MRLKYREIKDLYETIQLLIPLHLTMPFGYQVAKTAKELRECYNEINKKRQDIIAKYAEKNENGIVITENGNVEINKENVNKLDRELSNLFDTTISIDLDKFDIDDVKDLDLTVGQIETLIPIIEIKKRRL